MNQYTTKEIREAVIAELKDRNEQAWMMLTVKHVIDRAFKRLPDRLPETNKMVFPVSGSLLLHDLFQVAAIENEDGMPVIKYVDKPNGGSVAYVRHDAMVNKLNSLNKSVVNDRLPDDSIEKRIHESATETVLIHSIATKQREACAAWAENNAILECPLVGDGSIPDDRLPDGTLAAKCGKCEMLGDAAPCDECYRNSNYR